MHFTLEKSLEILERTPEVLHVVLQDLSAEWTMNNEGADTWSAYDVVGHLVYCEKADWILRAEIILADKPDTVWEPFDRTAHFKESQGKSLLQLLNDFRSLRKKNIDRLKAKSLDEKDLEKKGKHPAFGTVNLSQLLAAWVVHDLNHVSQISRVMARQYDSAVGPWKQYLGILQR